jgi:serine/threonine protein kinase
MAAGTEVEKTTPQKFGLAKGEWVDDMWVLGDCLGEGSEGSVFECRSRYSESTAYDKVMKITGNARSLLLTEASISREVYGENIRTQLRDYVVTVETDGVGHTAEYRYIVTPRLRATAGQMKAMFGVLNEDQIAKVAIGCFRSLRALATCKYIHRDIKPDNIMFKHGEDEKVMLIDYGAVKHIRDAYDGSNKARDPPYSLTGTPGFCSPTVQEDFGIESQVTDVEGLAFTLFYLNLDGTLPWHDALSEADVYKEKKEFIDSGYNDLGYCKSFRVQCLLTSLFRLCKRLESTALLDYAALEQPWVQLYGSRENKDELSRPEITELLCAYNDTERFVLRRWSPPVAVSLFENDGVRDLMKRIDPDSMYTSYFDPEKDNYKLLSEGGLATDKYDAFGCVRTHSDPVLSPLARVSFGNSLKKYIPSLKRLRDFSLRLQREHGLYMVGTDSGESFVIKDATRGILLISPSTTVTRSASRSQFHETVDVVLNMIDSLKRGEPTE